MANKYYDSEDNDKIVSDGDIAYADDLNKVNRATEAFADLVEEDIDSVTVLATSTNLLSKNWAILPKGTLPSNGVGEPLNTTEYSSKANAQEAASWASQTEDVAVVGADNISKTGSYSAKHWANKAEDSATSASTQASTALSSANSAQSSAIAALASENAAEAAALSAMGNNTISAGMGVSVSHEGSGPYNYIVSHTDSSSQSSETYSGANVVASVTLDTFGHVTGLTGKTLTYSSLGASPDTHRHTYYTPYYSAKNRLVGTTGTFTDWSCNNLMAYKVSLMDVISNSSNVVIDGVSYPDGNFGPAYDVLDLNSGALTVGGSSSALNVTNLVGYTFVGLIAGGYSRSIGLSGPSSTLYPAPDGAISLGLSSSRWSVVYAVTGTIQTSDERLKNFNNTLNTSFIYKLNPRSYSWKEDENEVKHFGFSAQEVEIVLGEHNTGLVIPPTVDEEGKESFYALNYSEFIAPMVKCIQDQKREIESLRERLSFIEVLLNERIR